jgi:hypothetical protein
MRDLNSMIDPATAVHVTLISVRGTNDDGWIVAKMRRLKYVRDARLPVE